MTLMMMAMMMRMCGMRTFSYADGVDDAMDEYGEDW